MSQRIAIISDHASPISDLGGVDSGGQNIWFLLTLPEETVIPEIMVFPKKETSWL